MTRMCPKCKNKKGLKFYNEKDFEVNLVLQNPYWKCISCSWLGFVTKKYCLRHKSEKLVFSRNQFYCLKCQRPALTSVEEKDSKYLSPTPIQEKKKRDRKKISLRCPKCNGGLYSSFIKGMKIGEENVPLWCCRGCSWQGIRIKKQCRRCGNPIVLTKEKLDCVYCHKLISSANDFLKEKEKYKNSLAKL